ncbi:hypothetical protein RFI_35602, partial [Reticulomyxa filosa]
NDKQLNDAFNSLKDIFNKERLTLEDMFNKEQLTLEDIHNKENLVGTFNCEESYKYANLLYGIAQRLDEKQMNMALNYSIDKLKDKNEHQNIRIECIKILEIISKKCNEKQLNE